MRHVATNIIENGHGAGLWHGYVGHWFTHNEHAIVLSGGGIDSFMSAYAYTQIHKVKKLTFLCIDYGQQSSKIELEMTKKQAAFFNQLGYETEVISITDNLVEYIRNPLKNRKEEKKKAKNDYAKNDDYVPNRNARFVFTAAGLAETIKAGTIILGAVGNVNLDNSLVFLENAYETICYSNRDVKPSLYAPFVLLSKSMVALYAKEKNLLSNIALLSVSCFDATEIIDNRAYQCGECRSCASLKQAFAFAGVYDPYQYEGKSVI